MNVMPDDEFPSCPVSETHLFTSNKSPERGPSLTKKPEAEISPKSRLPTHSATSTRCPSITFSEIDRIKTSRILEGLANNTKASPGTTTLGEAPLSLEI